MHVLIEVSRILEGTSAHHVEWSLKFGLSRWDLPTEEKTKTNKEKNQVIGFQVKIQRGITLSVLNEIMRFKRLFVRLNKSIICGGGLLIHRYILNS